MTDQEIEKQARERCGIVPATEKEARQIAEALAQGFRLVPCLNCGGEMLLSPNDGKALVMMHCSNCGMTGMGS